MIRKRDIDDLSYSIIGAAIEVHRFLGPGLLENVYHKCLAEEFEIRDLEFQSERRVPLIYKGKPISTDLRCDFLVENLIVVEIKSVERMIPVFTAQVLSYMHLLEAPKGILINFNVSNIFKEGQKTLVNSIYKVLPE